MDLLLLVLVIVALVLLVALLAVLIYRQNRSSTHLLMLMVSQREQTIQSLLNQLRSSTVSDLAILNSVTSSGSNEPDGYVSQSDAAEFERFGGGIGDELTQEDYAAFGVHYVPDES